jgi:hypothetical protein
MTWVIVQEVQNKRFIELLEVRTRARHAADTVAAP